MHNLKGSIPTEIGNLSNLNYAYTAGGGQLVYTGGLLLNNNCLSIDSNGIKAIKSLDVYNKGHFCRYNKVNPNWPFLKFCSNLRLVLPG